VTIRSFLGTLAVLAIALTIGGHSNAAPSPAPSPSPAPAASASPNPVLQALQNVQRSVKEEGQQLAATCVSLHAGTFVDAKTDKRFPHSYLVGQLDCTLASYRITWKRIGTTHTQTPAPSST